MCTSPLPARRVNGQIEFLQRAERARFASNATATLQIPCGQCAECRLKRSREWAVRCMHEASLHHDNCFLTLTYSDVDGVVPMQAISLCYSHYSGFMKRLREHNSRFARCSSVDRLKPDKNKILFLAAGEYGETNPLTGVKDGGKYRAHFHAILFNYNFPDRVPVKLINGGDYWKSALADRLWGHGNVIIGKVEFESAAYVARYAMKKVTGDLAKSVYSVVMPDGEIIERVPEMMVMSKRPAIGARWFEKYGRHAYAHDSVIARGVPMQPPRYYDKLLPKVVRGMIQEQREVKGSARRADHTDERNNVRNDVVLAGLNQVERK